MTIALLFKKYRKLIQRRWFTRLLCYARNDITVERSEAPVVGERSEHVLTETKTTTKVG